MKKVINNRSHNLILVSFIVLFLSIGTIYAQNQNKRQRTNKAQRFIDVDINRDSYISQDEYQFGSFNEFDTDQDGKLSRIEYQKKNRRTNRNSTGKVISGNNKGKGNCQVTQRGNGRGRRINQGNGQKKGTGVCPNGNQCPRKKNSTIFRGRKAS